jgi:hypothetical protein
MSLQTTFALNLNGTTAGTQHDQLATSSFSLNGATLSLTIGFVPAVGDQFTIITGDEKRAPRPLRRAPASR